VFHPGATMADIAACVRDLARATRDKRTHA
jgi:hypothetical protein